jgi:ATP-binding cassette subfamily B protein
VVGYAGPYRVQLAVVFATIILITLITLLPPLLIRDLLDKAIPDKNIGRVTVLGLLMVTVPLVNGMLGVLQRWASARAGEGIIFDLRRQLFAHLQGMSLNFFTNTRTGELMSRLNNDVVGAQQAITGTLVTIVSNGLVVILTLGIMFRLEWRLTLLAIAVLPLFLAPSRRVGKALRRVAREQMERNADMNATMNEALNVSGALLVKLFGRAGDEEDKFTDEAADVRDLGVRRALIGRWFFMALGLVSALGTAAVFWLGAVLVINGDLTTGTLVAMSVYLRELYGPLAGLSNARVELATSLVSFERVFEVIDIRQEIIELPHALEPSAMVGEIEFDGVTFDYRAGAEVGLRAVKRVSMWRPQERVEEDAGPDLVPTRRKALEEVTFKVAAGELVALVGPSGAGKTTITYLVPRLYDTTEGSVRIDGHDVRDVKFDWLSHNIGVVTQESYLFHDSIAANLRYAKPAASQEELEAAARAANIHTFISSLPRGYETRVGERGYRLSGGEKQRVAIARVILKDPRILILDEATSHLDARSESLIQEALDHIMQGRSSLVIAHRLSTILAADRILVLDEGRVVEQGTHTELLARGGLYSRLYETQFQAVSS